MTQRHRERAIPGVEQRHVLLISCAHLRRTNMNSAKPPPPPQRPATSRPPPPPPFRSTKAAAPPGSVAPPPAGAPRGPPDPRRAGGESGDHAGRRIHAMSDERPVQTVGRGDEADAF